jgi:hypothetical protein
MRLEPWARKPQGLIVYPDIVENNNTNCKIKKIPPEA